jgi:regulator of protease activity HflC (stomatin/prohibitin superfamily)
MGPNPISLAVAVVLGGLAFVAIAVGRAIAPGAILIVLAVLALASLKMARQWERAIVLRAGKFTSVKGPGVFWIIPILDNVAAIIDTRVRTTQFVAEQTLTKDTVPVDVDAIIFWLVTNAQRAALEVASYVDAISWAAQTSLREMIAPPSSRSCCPTARRSTSDCDCRSMRRRQIGGSTSGQLRSATSKSRCRCRMR